MTMFGSKPYLYFAPFLALLVSLASCAERSIQPPEQGTEVATQTLVQTREGDITGFIASTGASVWLGVPFAKPPIGELRWRAPKPPMMRQKPMEALRFASVCAQLATPLGGAPEAIETGTVWGSEDCLYLNIYAPPGVANAPVMLWIHGGGNVVGHSSFYDGGELAMAHNLVVVTINYRLGPFGWMHHPSLVGASRSDQSGNYGTLDIIQALTWVRNNIAAFGGQPDRITIFGESAGATNVASMIASPLAKGLFQGAIMQSGNVASSTSLHNASAFHDQGSKHTNRWSSSEILLRMLMKHEPNCDRTCAKAMLAELSLPKQAERLRRLSVIELFSFYGERIYEMPRLFNDGYVLPRSGMLSAFNQKDNVPMIIGTNKDETKLFMAFNPEHTVQLAGLPIKINNPEHYNMIAKYDTMVWKFYGVDAPAVRLVAAKVPVWTYRFDWDDPVGLPFIDFESILGAAHAFEIPFVFGNFWLGGQTSLLFGIDNQVATEALAERIMAYWAAFAYHKDPGQGKDGKGPNWPSYKPDAGVGYLILDDGEAGIRLTDDERPLAIASIVRQFEQETSDFDAKKRCDIASQAFNFSTPKPVYYGIMAKLSCALEVDAKRG